MGLDPSDPETHLSNTLLLRTLAVLLASCMLGSRHGSHEHPASAFSWHQAQVKRLFARPGCSAAQCAACAFGALSRKETRMGLVRGEHVMDLARPCAHAGAHEAPLHGSATTAAAQYPEELCAAFAARTRARLGASEPFGSYAADERHDAGRLEQPFLNEVLRSSEWRVIMRSAVTDQAHINALEVRAAMRALMKRALRERSARQLYVLDSMVGIGACAKGRSASAALNAELMHGLPTILAQDHYPGFDLGPTRLNPGDHISRGVALPRPTMDPPQWLLDAANGDEQAREVFASLPRQPRVCSEWGRIAFKLVALYAGR